MAAPAFPLRCGRFHSFTIFALLLLIFALLLFNVVLTLLLVHVRYRSTCDQDPERLSNDEPAELEPSECATRSIVLHVWPEELHVSVKTTVSHHASRLPHLARTWMQSLHPHQVVMRVPSVWRHSILWRARARRGRA